MSRTNHLVVICVMAVLSSGCSLRTMAINSIGEMLASDESVFTSDDDVELIGTALPFSLKLVESLLAEAPDNENLLLTAARGYTLYSYAYVDFPGEQIAFDDLQTAQEFRRRARRLYLRAFDYAMRGLEVDYPGIQQALMQTPNQAADRISGEKRDLAFLYWAAVSLGLAISVSKDDPGMLARLPEVEALLQRGLALNEDFDDGAFHEFAVTWAGSTPASYDEQATRGHYERALELSAGRRSGLYVAYAMTVSVPAQDRQQFTDLIEQALAVDLDAAPNERLPNVIAQRRAHWLLTRIDELFLE